ncbi:MAG: hypothetical protein Q8N61_01840 [bacterium]|nr:hypothetical protein [bacterium]
MATWPSSQNFVKLSRILDIFKILDFENIGTDLPFLGFSILNKLRTIPSKARLLAFDPLGYLAAF